MRKFLGKEDLLLPLRPQPAPVHLQPPGFFLSCDGSLEPPSCQGASWGSKRPGREARASSFLAGNGDIKLRRCLHDSTLARRDLVPLVSHLGLLGAGSSPPQLTLLRTGWS